MFDNHSRSHPTDGWNAGWIWCEGESSSSNFYLYARKAFKLSAKPLQASLRLAANNRYKLYVNGNYVGRGPVTSDSSLLTYDIHDVAPLLSKGANVIAVLVHAEGATTPGLICEADIERDGGSEKVVTDETWRVLPAAAHTASEEHFCHNEVFDARLVVPRWTEAGFRDSRWAHAIVISKPPAPPFGRLIPQQAPAPREELVYPASVLATCDCPAEPERCSMARLMAREDLKPLEQGKVEHPEKLLSGDAGATVVKVPKNSGVSIILDFGREVFGCVEMDVDKSGGGTIDIGYDIFEDESAESDSNESGSADRVILNKGRDTWTSFQPRAFRYIQMDLRDCPRPVSINHIAVRDATYPVELTGTFESSEPALNQVWKTSVDLLRHQMADVYADWPRDEPPIWWQEPSIAAALAGYAFGDVPLLEEDLRRIARLQRRDGAIVPPQQDNRDRATPDFGALWVMSVADYCAQSDNTKLMSDLYPVVARWLRWMNRHVEDDLLMPGDKGNLFIDWGQVDLRGQAALLNCLYIGALRSAAQMAGCLGRSTDAHEWDILAASLKAAVAKHFWSPKQGLYADVRVDGQLKDHFSRATNILAALFDVPNHYQKSSIFRQVIDEGGLPPAANPFFSSLMMKALCRSGYTQEALDLTRHRWGKMVAEGTVSPGRPLPMGVAYQLQSHFLGIRPMMEPGRIRVEPHPADIRWAKGKTRTDKGPVSLEWSVDRRGFAMTIDVPEGIVVEIVPPRPSLLSRVRLNNRDVHEATVEVKHGAHRVQVFRESMARVLSRPPAGQEIEQPRSVEIPTGRGDIETVEQMIRILTELGQEQQIIVPEEEAEQTTKRRRSRRRPKGRRAPARTGQGTDETTEAAESVPEVEQSVVSPSASEPEPAEQSGRKRRGRRSPAKPSAGEPQIVQPEEQPAPTTEPAAEEMSATAGGAPSGRRRRRASTKAKPKDVEVQPPTPAPSNEVSESEAKSAPKRRAPRRRKPSADSAKGSGSIDADEKAEHSAVQDEAQIIPTADADQTPAGNGSKPRKPSRRRKPASDQEQVTGDRGDLR